LVVEGARRTFSLAGCGGVGRDAGSRPKKEKAGVKWRRVAAPEKEQFQWSSGAIERR